MHGSAQEGFCLKRIAALVHPTFLNVADGYGHQTTWSACGTGMSALYNFARDGWQTKCASSLTGEGLQSAIGSFDFEKVCALHKQHVTHPKKHD